jgi:phosphoribosylglycinamide formyltransferase-1
MEPPTRPTFRLVLAASGHGSNAQAVIDACAAGSIDAEVVAVVSDRSDAYALERATRAGIPAVHIGRVPEETRSQYDARLAIAVADFDPDAVVLLGWMRILTMAFLGRFPGQVINLHPALPGQLPGIRAIERAWHEAMAGQRHETGVMVHLVPDEGIDVGPVLDSETVAIHSTDSFETLAARVHAAEHRVILRVLQQRCAEHSDIADTGAT